MTAKHSQIVYHLRGIYISTPENYERHLGVRHWTWPLLSLCQCDLDSCTVSVMCIVCECAVELLTLPACVLLSLSLPAQPHQLESPALTEILSQSACSQMPLDCLPHLFQRSVKHWRGDTFSLLRLSEQWSKCTSIIHLGRANSWFCYASFFLLILIVIESLESGQYI